MQFDKIKTIFKNSRITRNPFLLFLPFLLLYTGFVSLLHSNTLWGDEIRHYISAQDLLNGFYSPAPPNISLETGPGYPLLILPFLKFHLPLICIKLLNAVFQYLSIIFLFKALLHVVSFRTALIFCLFWGSYFNHLDFIAFLYAESLSIFLTSLLLFFIIKAFNKNELRNTRKYFYLAGITLGYLALTKVIFGYIIIFMLICTGLLWIISRRSANYGRVAYILLIAFATTSPYLIYTYQLTGRIFYWGTSGGNNLYWMSNPVKEEYGDWLPTPKSDSILLISEAIETETKSIVTIKNNSKKYYARGMADSIRLHHQKDFEIINSYKGVEKDDAYKSIMISNIKSHPGKFMINWISNVGRILFNYPYSYTYQKPTTLLRLPHNGIIVILMICCLIPTLVHWRKIIFPIRFMLFFILIYLGASSLGSAETRMFTVVVPMLLFWIAFIIRKSITIKIKEW